jgi:radical SAM-linked protein
VDPGSASPPASNGAVDAAPRQRWRLVLARAVDAPHLAGRELTDAWEVALEGAGLPLYRAAGRARARVAFGAQLPMGIAAERELADIVLTRFIPTWQVREALSDRIPEGWRLVDLYDVWLNRPPLAGQVAAADYRIDLGDADRPSIEAAARALLAADRLPRERRKGVTTVEYDLRPLIADVAVCQPGPPLLVRVRTRFLAELGTGRPDEVVAALGDLAGTSLTVGPIVRERVLLGDELG